MKKIDWTKPIRHVEADTEAIFIGMDKDRAVVKLIRDFTLYVSYDEYGRSLKSDEPRIVNTPILHKRWLVLFLTQYLPHDVRVAVYSTPVTKDGLAVYDTVLAVKEVTVYEGEGL